MARVNIRKGSTAAKVSTTTKAAATKIQDNSLEKSLNDPMPTTKRALAKRTAPLGFLGRDAFNTSAPPEGNMRSQIDKQVGRSVESTRLSTNPMHGLAIQRLSEELMGRITAARQGEPDVGKELALPEAHLRASAVSIRRHQEAHGAGDTHAAQIHLEDAAGHLKDAISAVPKTSTILRDSWTNKGTPWRVPKSEDPKEHSDFVSLENAPSEIDKTVKLYKSHLQGEGHSTIDYTPEAEERALNVVKTAGDLTARAASRAAYSSQLDIAAKNVAGTRKPAAPEVIPAEARKKAPKDAFVPHYSEVVTRSTGVPPLLTDATDEAGKPVQRWKRLQDRREQGAMVAKNKKHFEAKFPGKDFYSSPGYTDPEKYSAKAESEARRNETMTMTPKQALKHHLDRAADAVEDGDTTKQMYHLKQVKAIQELLQKQGNLDQTPIDQSSRPSVPKAAKTSTASTRNAGFATGSGEGR